MGTNATTDTKNSSSKRLEVFNIRKVEGAEKPFFKSVGVAFVNKDGSMNVILDSLPLDGKLHIREARAKSGEGSERER